MGTVFEVKRVGREETAGARAGGQSGRGRGYWVEALSGSSSLSPMPYRGREPTCEGSLDTEPKSTTGATADARPTTAPVDPGTVSAHA